MLSSEQAKTIVYLYSKFLESELKGWNQIDDYLEALSWLDDDQLYREAEVLYINHKNKKMGCPYDHQKGTMCFVPRIIEAVEAITDLYKEMGILHPKNRYVLEYYISLCQDQQILELAE